MPTTARTAPWASCTGKATAAWALTALAPGAHAAGGVVLDVAGRDRLVVLEGQAGHALALGMRRHDLLHRRRDVHRRGQGQGVGVDALVDGAGDAAVVADERLEPGLGRRRVELMAGSISGPASLGGAWPARSSQAMRSRKSAARSRSASVVGRPGAGAARRGGCARRSPARKAASPTRRWHSCGTAGSAARRRGAARLVAAGRRRASGPAPAWDRGRPAGARAGRGPAPRRGTPRAKRSTR